MTSRHLYHVSRVELVRLVINNQPSSLHHGQRGSLHRGQRGSLPLNNRSMDSCQMNSRSSSGHVDHSPKFWSTRIKRGVRHDNPPHEILSKKMNMKKQLRSKYNGRLASYATIINYIA
jgi:hypothetical protein